MKKINVFIGFTLGLYICLFWGNAFAQHTESTVGIPATINISVCGDGVAEGNEDCDLTDLGGGSCITEGFDDGIISCDASCSFDISLCVTYPDDTSDDSNDSDDSDRDSDDGNDDEVTQVTIIQRIIQIVATQIPLPDFLKIYDINNNDKLDYEELYDSIRFWYGEWLVYIADLSLPLGERAVARGKQWTCDLNEDTVCNLVDFSILLYHIDGI